MQITQKYVGHGAIRERLNAQLSVGRVGQSLLLSGPSSVGKRTLAHMLAKSLVDSRKALPEFLHVSGLKKNETWLHRSDRSSSQSSLSDNAYQPRDPVQRIEASLLTVSPFWEKSASVWKRKNVPVRAIRQVREVLLLSVSQKKRSVVIIDDAHTLDARSQNALLKTLEEPLQSAHIILITERRESLLPTILSRVEEFLFGLLDDAELKELIDGVDETGGMSDIIKEEESLLSLALGRPGLLFRMLSDHEELNARQEMYLQWVRFHTLSARDKIFLAEQYAQDPTRAIELLDLWMYEARRQAYKDPSEQVRNFHRIRLLSRGRELLLRRGMNAKLVLSNVFLACK